MFRRAASTGAEVDEVDVSDNEVGDVGGTASRFPKPVANTAITRAKLIHAAFRACSPSK
jgi:hypothetical protein